MLRKFFLKYRKEKESNNPSPKSMNDNEPIKDEKLQYYVGMEEKTIKHLFKNYMVAPSCGLNDTIERVEVREFEATHIFMFEKGICKEVLTFPDKHQK